MPAAEKSSERSRKTATRVYDHTAVLILALDTTTRGGSVAVTRDDDLLALVEGDASRTHGERMPSEMETALQQAGIELSQLDLLVVASGPGAFTGLRIGLAAIQGLALVTRTPVVGVSALDALAWTAWRECGVPPSSAIAAWMDAQRGEVYGAMFEPQQVSAERPVSIAEPTVGVPLVMLDAVEQSLRGEITFVGDGAVHHHALIEEHGKGRWTVHREVPPLSPALARIGRRLAARGEAGPPHALRPLYVRRPDAELERDRRTLP